MDSAGVQPSIRGSAAAVRRIGCVSFLNALPLIEGLDNRDDLAVHPDVPSRLLDDLLGGGVDVALCPVIDLQRSEQPLVVVPAGGIGCDGPTLTVRLYSTTPIKELTEVYADTDSHTSVVLLRVLLAELYGIRPALIGYDTRARAGRARASERPQAMLLIGDKVVTAAPSPAQYPHQLDLGQAWSQLTDLPFVFAVWMARQGSDLGDLAATLDAARRAGESRIDAIVARHAARRGWPNDLALEYLGRWLRYEIGDRQIQAMNLFFDKAHALGLIRRRRPINLHS